MFVLGMYCNKPSPMKCKLPKRLNALITYRVFRTIQNGL